MKDKLIKKLRVRVGDIILDQFSQEELSEVFDLSLSAFNMEPVVSYLKFDDIENIDQLSDLLVSYAAYLVLSSVEFRNNNFNKINIINNIYEAWYRQVRDLKTSDSFYYEFSEVKFYE